MLSAAQLAHRSASAGSATAISAAEANSAPPRRPAAAPNTARNNSAYATAGRAGGGAGEPRPGRQLGTSHQDGEAHGEARLVGEEARAHRRGRDDAKPRPGRDLGLELLRHSRRFRHGRAHTTPQGGAACGTNGASRPFTLERMEPRSLAAQTPGVESARWSKRPTASAR